MALLIKLAVKVVVITSLLIQLTAGAPAGVLARVNSTLHGPTVHGPTPRVLESARHDISIGSQSRATLSPTRDIDGLESAVLNLTGFAFLENGAASSPYFSGKGRTSLLTTRGQSVDWDQAKDRAYKLMDKLRLATASNDDWTDPHALFEQFGQGEGRFEMFQDDRDIYLPFNKQWDTVWSESNIPNAPSQKGWVFFTTQRDEKSRTAPFYAAWINPHLGLMVVENMYSPASQQNGKIGRASDALFLAWKYVCNKYNVPLDSLKYFAVTSISNPATTSIGATSYAKIGRAGAGNRAPMINDADTMSVSTDSGAAILGSPSGIPSLWMFIDHFDELGRKMPVSVKLWREQTGTYNLFIPLQLAN